MKTTLIALGASLLASCATTPTPNFEAERVQLFGRNEVLCFISGSAAARERQPQEHVAVEDLLKRRGVICTPEMRQAGGEMIIVQADRERRIAEMQSQERQASAGRFADGALRALGGFAAGYAAGAAMTPSPSPTMHNYIINGRSVTCTNWGHTTTCN